MAHKKDSYFMFKDLVETPKLQPTPEIKMPEPYWGLIHLLWNSAILMIITWYFDNVIPSL